MRNTEHWLESERLDTAENGFLALVRAVSGLREEAASAEKAHHPALRDTAWLVAEESQRACRRVATELRRSASHVVSRHADDLGEWAAGAGLASEAGAAYAVDDEPATAEARRLLRRLEHLAATMPGAPELDDLVSILEAMADLAPRPSPSPPSSAFTEAELGVLEKAGIDIDARPSSDTQWRSQEAYARLLAHALPVDEAARRLGVDASRVYQRLKSQTLYGVRVGGRWRLPAFQFTDSGEVPGIGAVIAALPDDLHPLSVSGWFGTPKDDLRPADGAEPQAPREWLLSGGDPGVAAGLAADEAVGP